MLDVDRAEGLSATGLLLCNAPFSLEAEMREPLAALAQRLAQGPKPYGTIAALGNLTTL
jgi:23S rRNA A2030 N6-methylase RlmJ